MYPAIRRSTVGFWPAIHNQTNEFTWSQRECSFVLMFRNFVVLLSIVRSILNIVFSHTVGSFAKIVSEITVAGFAHGGILAVEVTGLVRLPRKTGIFSKSIRWMESRDVSDFSNYTTGKNRFNGGIDYLDFFLKVSMQLKELAMDTFKGSYSVLSRR